MTKLTRSLKALCAIGLVLLLAEMVDWDALPGLFADVSVQFAVAGFVGLCVQFLTSTWKWRHAMRIHDLDGRFWALVRIYGTGFFMNNFLPSAIGGDAYRVVSTIPADGAKSRAVSAVLVERIVGFAALALLGCIGALALFEQFPVARFFLAVNVACGCAGLLLLLLARTGFARRLFARAAATRVGEAIAENLKFLRHAGVKWLALIGSSLLFQAIAIAIIHLLFRALHVEVSIAACALIAAVAGIASVLPISINGIGVIEGSFAGTAVAVGVDYEIALAVALLIRILVVPASVLFGALYLWRGSESRSPVPSAVKTSG